MILHKQARSAGGFLVRRPVLAGNRLSRLLFQVPLIALVKFRRSTAPDRQLGLNADQHMIKDRWDRLARPRRP